MEIKDYTSYFHDGSVTSIKQNNNKIEILMESAEIPPEWNITNIPLSSYKTITEKLTLLGVKSVSVNDSLVKQINQNHDDGEVLKFRIDKNTVDLIIEWCDYAPKERTFQFEHIVIQASQIEWKNNSDELNQ